MTATLQTTCPAIECDGCAQSIQRSLGKLSGVENITVEVATKTVTVQYDDAQVAELTLRTRLEQAGFPPA